MVKLPWCHDCPNTFYVILCVHIHLLDSESDLVVDDGAGTPPPALASPVGQDLVGGAHHHVLQGQAPPLVVPRLRGYGTIRGNLPEEGLKIIDLVV